MLSFISLAILVASVSASLDNSGKQAELQAASQTFPDGNYIIQNAATGQALTYVQGGQQIFPSTGAGSAVAFEASDDGFSTRVSMGNNKCLSAQWGQDASGAGVDWAGVLYACAVGDSGLSTSTVRGAKQWWLFVPVGGNVSTAPSTSSTDSTDSTTDTTARATVQNAAISVPLTDNNKSSCGKSQAWIQRHPAYVRQYNHPECAALLRDDQKSSYSKRNMQGAIAAASLDARDVGLFDESVVGVTKRATGTAYYIIPTDHLADMATRALTGTVVVTNPGTKTQSTKVDPFVEGQQNQQWIVTPA